MTFNLKTNFIVNKLLESNKNSDLVIKYYKLNDKNDRTNYTKVINDSVLRMVTKFDYTANIPPNFTDIPYLCSNDIFKLLQYSPKDYSQCNTNMRNSIFYNANIESQKSVDFNRCDLSWVIIYKIIIGMIDHHISRTSIQLYIYLEYDNSIKEIIQSHLCQSKSILTKTQYSTILLNLTQTNIKLNQELIDGLQSTHINNYILRKIHNFATLIDFGYKGKINKDEVFDIKYLSLRQICDILMINDEDDFNNLKKILSSNSICSDIVDLIEKDDVIFSWNHLAKIINKNTYIDCISEKKYMKYVQKMYTECIEEILIKIYE